ncbi:MAG: DUF1501 domain-containing protein [Planctomycetota bacterium]
MKDPTISPELLATRRHFFGQCALGLGAIAFNSMYATGEIQGAPSSTKEEPLSPRPPHFAPKAKRVIYLFMAGGPSQIDLFDPKPKLAELSGQIVPESFTKEKRFAFIGKDAKLLGSKREFKKYGPSGMEISNLLPHLASIADQVTFIRSMKTDVFNHGPAKCFINTGSPVFGRPSMGAWVTYGIGSESRDLPGFVVLNSGPRGPRGGTSLYASGFLPTTYQGVPLRSSGEPILNLTNPPGVTGQQQRQVIDTVNRLNATHYATTGDDEIATRISAYEMAFRMQTSAPDLIDLTGESKATLDLYGVDPDKPSFARNCLLARRLVERGVRFVQLYHTDWDHHGDATNNLAEALEARCKETDQASAALVKDLASRGLLDDTLVVWGGEFGRTPMGENRDTIGRDHHIDAFTVWLAGGGVKPGLAIGKTDDLGFYVEEDPVHVHDLQATILHLLGLDHKRLTFRFQGRDYRLTDVHGDVVQKILA